MKKLTLLLPSLLIVYSLTVYADCGTGEPKAPCPDSVAKTAGCYKVVKQYRLTQALHGVNGMLQLLQDSRVTQFPHNKQFGAAFALYQDDELIRLFKNSPPLGAVLRILMYEGEIARVEESHTFDHAPVSWLEEVRLSGSGTPSYLATCDLSTGIGAHSGTETYFYEVIYGKLRPIEYVDSKTKEKGTIALVRSLVTNWKLVKSKDGKSQDILYAECEPDASKDPVEFKVYYNRYHFNGKKWVRYQRVERGYWEVDTDELPPLSKFPAGP
jgi:hypothetical protein